ncbi:MAG: toxin-antitoxin system YwqK family antitoxin [Lentimicrobium sp.]|nr:toxin-antitoxin system YwqK family antitoxin [Lentimicrobium sp.]
MKKQLFLWLMGCIFAVSVFAQQDTKPNKVDDKGLKQGLWLEKSGVTYSEGNYLNNLKDGLWLTHAVENDMLIQVENYKQGIKNGIFVEISKQGNLVSEQYFTNNIPDGPHRIYGPGGSPLAVNNYREGQLHGIQVVYYENLRKKSEESNYVNGVKDGLSRWYNTEGNILVEYNYVNGLLEGEQKSFYSNKNIRTSEIYKNNQNEGAYLEYHENGSVKVTGEYKAGLKDGKWIEYDENGKIIKTSVFAKGTEK